jgi:hypothetical protein
MANTRGKDYDKRLNYDELKDKITKNKKPINAPYRTATIIRNSNQMQNLLAMSTLDMEEHQVKLQNEQVKQAKKDEMIKKEQPKSNVPVVSIADDVERTQDDLQSVYEDNYELLAQRQKEQEETLNNKNKQDLGETGNQASERAKNIVKGLQMAAGGAANENVAKGLQMAADGDANKELQMAALYEYGTGGASSSRERATTPSPSKPAPGEEFGQTPERNVNAELAANQRKANKTKIDTIIRYMNDAYESKELNDTQAQRWEQIMKEGKNLDVNDKEDKENLAEIIRQEYVMYLSYKKGLFKTRSPSRPKSVSRPRSQSRPRATSQSASAPSSSGMQPILTEAVAGDTGGEGTKRGKGRPLGSKNKPKE